MILIYIIHLKKVAKQTVGKARSGEISVNSIKVYLTGVQSFLESNEIILNWKKIAKYYPEQVSNILRAYTKEEIATLLSIAADLRDPEEKYQATQNLDRICKDLRDSGISF